MNTKTLISGQAAVAVLVDGEGVTSYHLDGPQGVERHPQEIGCLFADCPDVIALDGFVPEEVPARLELEWAKDRCLTLCMLLLNPDSSQESRLMAASDIEEFFGDSAVLEFVANRLYVAPLPESADLMGSINRAAECRASRLVGLLEEVGTQQEEIARCREAWDAIPEDVFGDQSTKEAMAFDLVQSGKFRLLVKTGREKQKSVLVELLSAETWQQFRGWRRAW